MSLCADYNFIFRVKWIFLYLCADYKFFAMEQFIGRTEEIKRLERYLASERSEFVAVYGRRRIGKTFFVRHVVSDKVCFSITGMDNVSMRDQLFAFNIALRRRFHAERQAKNWIEAFALLAECLENMVQGTKIIFIDELPWFDTPKSRFVSALEHFWNGWASARGDVKLIVCGSATSWMINKLINNRGGLHNRVTHSILLKPFTLAECQQYFDSYGFDYSQQEVADCYMVMGGVPYYFTFMDTAYSVAQNVDHVFFAPESELRNEFNNLYRSLFKQAEVHIKIVKALASKGKGLSRSEIVEATGIVNNGDLTTRLAELENCGLIRSYAPFSVSRRKTAPVRKSRETLYQLVDFYTLFYLKMMQQNDYGNPHFWTELQGNPLYSVWSGYAFEMLCLAHVEQIKAALGISGIQSSVCSWFGSNGEEHAQIDLLIDRNDKTINICEMKYADGDYSIDKSTDDGFRTKTKVFREATKTRKSLMFTLVTPSGLKKGKYSSRVQKVITFVDLFRF